MCRTCLKATVQNNYVVDFGVRGQQGMAFFGWPEG